jgi:lysophospholipase L1-like esterase
LVIADALTARAWSADEQRQALQGQGSGAEYVALGSSFAAGPGVIARAPDSPPLCARSAYNYPHLLAEKRRLRLSDVTCSGATAVNVARGGQQALPPQVDALAAATMLVTVTVGGNDVSYLGNLFAWSCQGKPESISPTWRALVCTPKPSETVDEQFRTIGDALRRVAEIVRDRSPRARLVFADYTTVLPEAGDCPDRLPISDQELDRGRVVAARLAAVTADVAQRTGSLLLRASEISKGHDVCAADPWVFGWVMPPTPFEFAPIAYHPTAKAMHAIADAMDRLLGR